MDRLKGVLRQLRTLVRGRAVDAERLEEMRFHIDMQTRKLQRAGMSPEDARRAAHVAFGGFERYREQRRQASWVRVVEDAAADVRYAGRTLRHRPAFAVAVALTLGLGVGGTSAIFSVVDGLFFRAPAGVRDAGTLRRLYIVRDEGMVQSDAAGSAGSFVDYAALREGLHSAESVASFLAPQLVDLGTGSEAEQIRLGIVSPNYFETVGARTERGHVPGAGEAGAATVVSHGFADRRLGGADAALGRTLLVDGQPITVVGVAQRGFTGLDAIPVDVWVSTDVAVSLGEVSRSMLEMEGVVGLVHMVARLAGGVAPETLEAEATGALTRDAEAHPALDPTPAVHTTSLVPAATPNGSAAADLSLWLALVAFFVLVIACANVANLLLARAVTRRRETAVRLSLGASRSRIARQHLAESLALAGLGALAALVVTWSGLALARPFPLPPSAGHLDGRLLLFALGLTLLTGLLFGLAPALRAGRVDTVPALRETRLNLGVGGTRARRALVALQVALSLVLLVGAGLFVRSLTRVYAIDPGLDLDRVATVDVDLSRAGYDAGERARFYEDAQTRLAALPQVERTALVDIAPFSGAARAIPWDLAGVEPREFREGPYFVEAGPGYFAALGTRVLAGREFTADDAQGEPVALVNEAMAAALAPAAPPGDHGARAAVGLCVALGMQVSQGGCTRIVGVVESYRHRYLQEADVPMVFLPRHRDPADNPWRSRPWRGTTVVVHTRGSASRATTAIRSAVQELRSGLPYVKVQPLESAIEHDVLPYRLGATLFSLFGGLAAVLAAVGLYGVLAYYVTERTPEIGLRRSLGAPVPRVVRLVVGQGMAPVVGGLAAGMLVAWAGTRFIGSLLFGVGARDPVAFAVAPLALLLVAGLATLLPARRAAGVDPMVALRED